MYETYEEMINRLNSNAEAENLKRNYARPLMWALCDRLIAIKADTKQAKRVRRMIKELEKFDEIYC